MISGTFHVSSQEWRYFAREKSIVHTLHLGQLPPTGTKPGDTVLIDSAAPSANNNSSNFSVPKISIPAFPDINITETVKTTRTTLPNVFGSVGMNKTILAQKNVNIQFAGWDPFHRQFYMTPNQSGWYYFYVEVQGDFRDISYLGPGNNPNVFCGVGVGLASICGNQQEIKMSGLFDATHWNSNMYISTRLRSCAHGIAVIDANRTVVWTGTNLGNAPDAQMTGYMFKIAEA